VIQVCVVQLQAGRACRFMDLPDIWGYPFVAFAELGSKLAGICISCCHLDFDFHMLRNIHGTGAL